MKKIFIYKLIDPTTNLVRYVGKTGNPYNRLHNHLSKSKTTKSKLYNWIRKLLNSNLKPIMEIIEECDSNVWESREKFWIKYYRDLGINLVNQREGGNQPAPKKKIPQKYYNTNNGFVVVCSFLNTRYYLGKYDTPHEAIEMYDKFQKDPEETYKEFKSKNIKPNVLRKPVMLFKNNEFIKEFDSVLDCAKFIGGDASNISRCCKGKYKKHKGYTFKYKTTEDFAESNINKCHV